MAVAGRLCVQPRERANRRLPSFFPGRAWGLDGVLERREANACDTHTHEGSRRSSCFAWFHDSSLYDAGEKFPWSSSSSSDGRHGPRVYGCSWLWLAQTLTGHITPKQGVNGFTTPYSHAA